MTRTITALFDTGEQAERAAKRLAAEVGGVRGTICNSRSDSRLDTLSVPAEDRAVLRENVLRGGAVFYAQIPDDKFDIVSEILEQEGAVDADEREASWRRGGWTPTAANAASVPGANPTAAAGSDERIPVVEEHLKIGKRETGHGRVRVRSYVVETPVQEQVTLRQESVEVERRPVDRPVAPGDDVFRDRVVEATETSEEAVVSKEARVTEEVVLRKHAEERAKTVTDTVRQTKVEVEDERTRPRPVGPDNKV